MEQQRQDIRASAPLPGGVGLLLIDFINRMTFDGADALLAAARDAAAATLRLRDAADALGIPVVYVNDNYGDWRSERARIVETCLTDDNPARDLVASLRPRPDDYFVIKPHLSGFYATSLPVLLPKLRVSRLVLTGLATDICVLFTAADAHMRDYDLWVPSDTVASEGADRTDWALEIMRNSMDAETAASSDLALDAWARRPNRMVDADGRQDAGENAERS